MSRNKLKEYTSVKVDAENIIVYDKNDSPIELKLIEKPECKDTYLYVRSKQKAIKEASMNEHFFERYEQNIENIRLALSKKGKTKKD